MSHQRSSRNVDFVARRRIRPASAAAFLAALCALLPVSPARAAIVATGNVDPANPSTWTTSTTGYIGNRATGTVTVNGGSGLLSGLCSIGYLSFGSATVTGAGSMWTNSSPLYVGYDGAGTLRVEDGGQVNNGYAILGRTSRSTGEATVTGPGSTWTNSSSLSIGESGNATLIIEAGGHVTSSYGYLGYEGGSTGTATVTGTDSSWTNSGKLYVGYAGNGTLGIQAGGNVSASRGYVGYDSFSAGTVTVDGPGSKWATPGTLYVGCSGTGTLNVSGGGLVIAEALILGDSTDSVGICNLNGGTLRAAVITTGTYRYAILNWNDGTIQNYDSDGDLNIPWAWGLIVKIAAAGLHTFLIDANRTGTISADLSDATSQGTIRKDGAGVLILKGRNTYSGGTTVAAGVLRIGFANSLPVGRDLAVAGAGSLASLDPGLDIAVQVAALDIDGGSATPSARLDLANNKLVADKTAVPGGLATVRAQIKNAYAAARWTGAGITSGTAAADYAALGNSAKTGVGYLDNGIPAAAGGGKTSWGGRSVDSNSVLVRYTYYGDANLDGVVNLTDFGILKSNFSGSGKNWFEADFNYDGVVNLFDFGKLKLAFGAPAIAAGAAMPEPGAAAMLCVFMPWWLARRFFHHNGTKARGAV